MEIVMIIKVEECANIFLGADFCTDCVELSVS
jgi:hypothetical protein